MSHQPGGERLRHLIFIGEVIGDASDDVAEHDSHEGHHHHVLKADVLDEPDEDPGSQDRENECENGSSHERGARHEQQGQKDAELRRGDGGSRGGRNEFVHAQLLHDQARHAHSHSGAENGKKPWKPGNQKDFQLLQIPCEQGG